MYSLIRRGKPDFIEIKSVTFCGVSDGSNLTMQNVPWYEVRNQRRLLTTDMLLL